MSKLMIRGGTRLKGTLKAHGAKNSVLPILAATLLARGQSVLHNCPELSDVALAAEILRHLGCKVEKAQDTMVICAENGYGSSISEELMREMRSSIIFLGAMAAKSGHAVLCAPGGCDLGPRPIDLHLSALQRMGMQIAEENGTLHCTVDGRLHGARIEFPFVSVGATENVMIAAATACGTTEIVNAACEPEIEDLAAYLNRCGARIRGAGTARVTIEGVMQLHGCEHRVIPDRIAAATYLSAAAVTGGDLILREVEPYHLSGILPKLERAGCAISVAHRQVRLISTGRLRAIGHVRTMPYPGFPTDAQAPLMAVAAVAQGETRFDETIFEDRFKHAPQLNKMGAAILTQGRTAFVHGVDRLHGAKVRATDLRGGAALVIAALQAEGITEITEIHHIDRGYENIEGALSAVGAEIARCEEWQKTEETTKLARAMFAV